MTFLYLSRAQVEETAIAMREVIDAVETAFVEKGHGRTEMPPKPGVHPRPNAFIHAMPAAIDALDAAGLKWVSGYPDNAALGLPYIGGLFVLNDPSTGLVRMVCDCTWITAVRTAAATAVAARRLAKPRAQSIALLGLGVQGRSHLDVLPLVLDHLETIYAFDVSQEQTARFAAYAADANRNITFVDDPRQAVERADIVVTAGPILQNPTPVIDRSWLAPGALVCPIDFDSYVRPNVLLGADRFVTDDVDQLAYYQTQGYFSAIPDERIELADVVIEAVPGRKSEDESIVVMNLGIALEDVAVAALIYRRATERGIGTILES